MFMSQRIPRLPDIEEKVHAAVYRAIVSNGFLEQADTAFQRSSAVPGAKTQCGASATRTLRPSRYSMETSAGVPRAMAHRRGRLRAAGTP